MLKQVDRSQFEALNPQSKEASSLSALFETSAYRYLTETFRDPLLINVLSGTLLKMELRRESLPLFIRQGIVVFANTDMFRVFFHLFFHCDRKSNYICPKL